MDNLLLQTYRLVSVLIPIQTVLSRLAAVQFYNIAFQICKFDGNKSNFSEQNRKKY